MSITAKNAKSIRKKDVKESKALANGFTKLVFAHKASAGETGIDLGSLVVPTEMTTLGFTNPTPSRLLEARMFQFKDNLEVQSSSKGQLMQSLSYTIGSNSRINFQGFTAEEGEIFIGVLDSNPISGIQVIDAKQPVVEGDLADGVTDFAIGFSTSIVDEILVFRNGLEQKRNTNNSSSVLDGNYYVVDSGSGYGNVVRFNVAPSGADDYIKVTAIGGVVESPTNSTWDELEKVQGQIDAMIPDLAQAAGNPETDYQSAPNNVDLKQFGDIVHGLLNIELGDPDNVDTLVVSSTGTILSQTGNIVSSISNPGGGQYTVNFTGLSNRPGILITTRADANDEFDFHTRNATNTSVLVRTRNNASLASQEFTIQVIKQGSDFVAKKTLRTLLEEAGVL